MDQKRQKLFDHILARLGLLALVSLGLGAVFQIILSIGDFLPGWLAASLLLFLSGVLIYAAWNAAGRDRMLAWILILAFSLRLALGVFLAWGLPQFGYDEEPQKAGFVFEDAYRRERNAWHLAKSGEPLMIAFGDAYETDQYGGILYLSAFVYRYPVSYTHLPGSLCSFYYSKLISLLNQFYYIPDMDTCLNQLEQPDRCV